ncbi:MAG: methionine--tRNA ligase, partial [Pseudomonadota bacterium]|nr:methionine--tRNA ligase [Pseudomonadota bacterium]
MAENKGAYYITTPIYYVNDKPHLGHTYTTVACDVLARFKRLDGFDVMFLTGTDEHGLKVKQAAEKKGITPQEHTDFFAKNFRDLAEVMNISNDDFIRTTEERHKAAAQGLWNKLVEKGQIYKDSYSGWYAVRDEAYYSEDELTVTEDGKRIAPSGAECEWMEEESYFFKLSEWTEPLLKFYEDHPDFIMPQSRKNEVISFVKGGLRDLSISRTTFDWGVKVPNDEGHVMYVWIDALTNYITALGFPDENADMYQKFWPANVHMVGKDIIRFHAVYWPAFLMAADIAPPKRVFAHGWWTIEGEKMSKSLGNVISPYDLIEKYGVDASRYFMLREVPFGNDGDFSDEQAVTRINAELANGLGNLAQRTLSMIFKNCDGTIPAVTDFTDADNALFTMIRDELITHIRRELDVQKFHEALRYFKMAVDAANAYIDEQAPWKLKKEDPERMKVVLYTLAECIRCLGLVIQPF